MNHQASSTTSSRAALGTLIAVIVLPVLYLLSVPPVAHYSFGAILKQTAGTNQSMEPRWLRWYCTPYEWLVDHTFLEVPLAGYRDRWMNSTTRDYWYYPLLDRTP